jgi:CHAT domain-containing protein/Tfp pilus assembly protein PilF
MAEAHYLQALRKEVEDVPYSPLFERTLSDLGVLFDQQGDLERAEAYHRRALSVAERLDPGSLDVADILANLAECLIERGHSAQAEVYEKRALSIREEADSNGLSSAYSFAGLGQIARVRGNLAQAEEYYRKSLAIVEKVKTPVGQRVDFLIGLAAVCRDRKKMPAAEQLYREALEIIETADPESVDHGSTLAELAGTVFRQNRLDEAKRLYEHAIRTFENRTLHLGGILETRSRYRAENIRYYQEYIDLLIQQGHPEAAFEVLESSRARTLFEMLAQSHVDVGKGGDPATRSREITLRRLLNAKAAYRIRVAAMGQSEQLRAIDKETDALLLQYQQEEAQLRIDSPGFAGLSQPPKLNVADIQALLDGNTLLLEYSVGDERSYVWAVGNNSLKLFELPKRGEIEIVARRVYDLLTWKNRTATTTQAEEDVVERKYIQAASKMSALLLGPVADLIPGKRLLIVSDGALQYIPFSALPTPGSSRPVPLIVKHEIVSLPSASVLAELRRQRIGRPKATRMVAVLADPVFDPKDERIRAVMRAPSPSPATGQYRSELTRSATDLGLTRNGRLYLNRLLYTRKEADAVISATLRGKAMLALDFEASRATATSPMLAQYRVVHFATHGILNNKHPELSGLVLSLVNKQGKAQNGFLKLQDIYNLKLPVDLVVLSGCETGLGEEIHGEGLIGLTRGFMYAGASRVVASLWSVSDTATANLMADFYKAMGHDGMSPAAALRTAQIQMWRQKQWNSPYYWAAFQIQGEWQ